MTFIKNHPKMLRILRICYLTLFNVASIEIMRDMIAPTERPLYLIILFIITMSISAFAGSTWLIKSKINIIKTIKSDINVIMETCNKQMFFSQLKEQLFKIDNSMYTNHYNNKILNIFDLFEKDFEISKIKDSDSVEIKLYQSEDQTRKDLWNSLYYYQNCDLKIGCVSLQE